MIKKLKNPAIKDAKFIVVPKIYDDELLSSWFIRTAYAHHTHPHTFLQLHLGKSGHSLNANNFDIVVDDHDLKTLSYKSNNQFNLYKATLQNYSGFLQEKIISNGLNQMLCIQRFCPKCLREKIVYFRKQWKVVFNTTCLKHQCILYDSCPKCDKSIRISMMYKKLKNFKYCYNCGFDLSKSRVLPLKETSLIQIEKLNTILNQGYIQLGQSIVYSFTFFEIILQLCKKILKHKKYKSLENHSLFNYLNFNKSLQNCKPTHIQIPIKEQFALFTLCVELFERYPTKIKQYIEANNLTHWQITKDMQYISFWFEELINSITPREVYWSKMVTDEEITNAKEYLISQKIEVNKSSMSRITGCNFHSSYNKLGKVL